jgi:2-desacetyl-2-hydroxyethyl bacteriochlorophyllide A dehydrogenase
MTSQGVTFPQPKQVTLDTVQLGDPGAGEVLVQGEVSLISTGTELTAFSGDFPEGSAWARYVRYPFRPGYSHVGRVVRAGRGVTTLSEGDRVVSMARHAGAALLPATSVRVVPEEVTAEEASFLTLAQIVLNGIRRGRVALGESVVIVGAGLLGQLATQFAHLCGAVPLIVVDPAEARLAVVKRHGATHVVAQTIDAAREAVVAATHGRMADVVFEVTGNPVVIPGALRLARRLGRVVLLGSPRGPVSVDFHDEAHTLGLEIIGAHNSTHPPADVPHTPWSQARHAELFFDLLLERRLDVAALVTHRYPGHQASEAYRMLLEDRSRALGVLFQWNGEGGTQWSSR